MKAVISPILFLVLLSLSGVAYSQGGGSGIGNGGDSVVCRDENNQIVSAELLDYYEGKELRQLELDYSITRFEEMVEAKLQEISRHDAQWASVLKQTTDVLVRGILEHEVTHRSAKGVVFTSNNLENLQDAKNVISPASEPRAALLSKGCKIEQLAIRLKKKFPDDPDFIIQKDIFAKLSPVDKAGLVLHEAIYKELNQGFDSRTARYLTEKISDTRFKEMTYLEYLQLMTAVSVVKVNRGNNTYSLATLRECHPRYFCMSDDRSKTSLIFTKDGILASDEMDFVEYVKLAYKVSVPVVEKFGSWLLTNTLRQCELGRYCMDSDSETIVFNKNGIEYGAAYPKWNSSYLLSLWVSSIMFPEKRVKFSVTIDGSFKCSIYDGFDHSGILKCQIPNLRPGRHTYKVKVKLVTGGCYFLKMDDLFIESKFGDVVFRRDAKKYGEKLWCRTIRGTFNIPDLTPRMNEKMGLKGSP